MLEHAVVAAGILLNKRLSRGHEKALKRLSLSKPKAGSFFFKPALSVVLSHGGYDTGHLRRCHGRTGHVLILIVSAGYTGSPSCKSVDRVDISAGSRDLRLKIQRFGHSHTGETAHGIVFALIVRSSDFVAYCNGTCIVRKGRGRRRTGKLMGF